MRPASPRLLSALLLLAAASTPAVARDGPGEEAIRLSSVFGVSGFQEMVDARTRRQLSARGGLRYLFASSKRDLRRLGAQGGELEKERELHEARAFGGVSARMANLAFDLGAGVSYRYVDDEDAFAPLETPPRGRSRSKSGYGDIDLAAKLTLPLPAAAEDYISLAPYALGRIPSARERVELPAQLEAGVALSLTLCDHFSLHGNLAGLLLEEGVQACRYRAGVSVSLGDLSSVLCRFFAYGSGLEYEGGATSDVDVEVGVQLLLARFLTLEVGGTYRVVTSGFRGPAFRREVARQPTHDRHPTEAFGALQVAIGVAF